MNHRVLSLWLLGTQLHSDAKRTSFRSTSVISFQGCFICRSGWRSNCFVDIYSDKKLLQDWIEQFFLCKTCIGIFPMACIFCAWQPWLALPWVRGIHIGNVFMEHFTLNQATLYLSDIDWSTDTHTHRNRSIINKHTLTLNTFFWSSVTLRKAGSLNIVFCCFSVSSL